MKNKKLYRVEDGKILGVCGGFAEYFDVDPTLIRVCWAVAAFAAGTGLLAYFICAICMPRKSDIR